MLPKDADAPGYLVSAERPRRRSATGFTSVSTVGSSADREGPGLTNPHGCISPWATHHAATAWQIPGREERQSSRASGRCLAHDGRGKQSVGVACAFHDHRVAPRSAARPRRRHSPEAMTRVSTRARPRSSGRPRRVARARGRPLATVCASCGGRARIHSASSNATSRALVLSVHAESSVVHSSVEIDDIVMARSSSGGAVDAAERDERSYLDATRHRGPETAVACAAQPRAPDDSCQRGEAPERT